MLDLGCGAGRHSRALASRGFDVTGLDLSAQSLARARRSERPNLRFRRHDMRLPFRISGLDAVLCLFTSFGYFEDLGDNLAVVQNVASSLRPGGTFVLDYLNAPHVEAHMTVEGVTERGGVTYRISRWSDRDFIFKRISIDDGSSLPRVFVERVAKLGLEDFRFMCRLCGLEIESAYGDYSLTPFDVNTSPRLILVATKSGADYFRDNLLRMRLTVSGVIPRYEASIV